MAKNSKRILSVSLAAASLLVGATSALGSTTPESAATTKPVAELLRPEHQKVFLHLSCCGTQTRIGSLLPSMILMPPMIHIRRTTLTVPIVLTHRDTERWP